MTKRERENWYRTVSRLVNLGIGFREAEELRRLSMRYNRSLEKDCSLDDGKQDYREREQVRIVNRALAMMPEGVALYVQGDCRGLSFYVCGEDIRRPLEQHYSDGVGV